MDNLTKKQRRYNMSRIRSTGTSLEEKFFRLLDDNKIRHINHPKIYGKPDCQIGNRILIFIDSDFWHGWHFTKWKERMPKNYWIPKIEKNIIRDRSKFRILRRQGYKVFRVWEHELINPEKIISKLRFT